ncbi:MAG TPA: YegS/Rv2252/BmrU family lipid kinase [Chitinophagaceae bacterium]|nr:YegS/Rv2252/BmrU family lipid kinase [Chitinophagaceae bacterium]
MRKIIFLVNPISGTSKKEVVLKYIETAFKKEKIDFEIIPTDPGGNYDFLKYKIQQEHITDVIVIGGDGSVNQVVQSLHTEPVRFGIIPLGSGNGFALAANIPRNLQKAIDIIIHGHAAAVDAFAVNDHFSCMLSGLGFDAKVAHEFANKAARGLLTYTQQSIIHFFKAQPYQFEIVLDNFSFFTDAFFISVANGNQFGNNFTIAPKAILNDGLLDVVIVQKMNKAKLPFAILKQLRGNNKLQQLVEDISKKNVLYFQTHSLNIKNLKYAPLHIDGEPMETPQEVKFEIIRNCFKLIQPEYSEN